MHLPISKEQHARLCKFTFKECIYGSHLFGTNTETSDKDIVRIYNYNDVFGHNEKNMLPNIHGFHYVDQEENIDYVWVTTEQFWNAIYSGEGTIMTDIYIFSDDSIEIDKLYTFKIIKAYLGVAKRDITQHKGNKKKLFNAIRCLEIAKTILDKKIPNKTEIIAICNLLKDTITPSELLQQELEIRKYASSLYETNQLHNYYIPQVDDDLLQIMLNANNVRQFKF